jgi:hypothetical protein
MLPRVIPDFKQLNWFLSFFGQNSICFPNLVTEQFAFSILFDDSKEI